MRKLSVGVFTYSTKPRGSVVHAAALVEALTRLGHDATLYALHKDGEGFYRPLHAKLALIPARPAPGGTDALVLQRTEELAAFLRSARTAHHVFHAEDCLVASGLLRASAAVRMPVLVRTIHHVERFDSPYLDRCQTASIVRADVLVAVSQATRRAVQARFGLDAAVIESGVDLPRFGARSRAAESALRERLGVSDEGPLLLSIGGVEPRKNTLAMLEGFVRARAAHPAAKWIIAGGASVLDHSAYVDAFERRLSELTAEARAAVVRVGVLTEEDLTTLIQTASVLVHTSVHEGWGLCVLEALAAGTPAVVSRGEPFDEYLDDSTAILVDPSSPEEIALGIEDALREPGRQTAAGRALAARYSWAATALRHVELYERARRVPPSIPLHPQQLATLEEP